MTRRRRARWGGGAAAARRARSAWSLLLAVAAGARGQPFPFLPASSPADLGAGPVTVGGVEVLCPAGSGLLAGLLRAAPYLECRSDGIPGNCPDAEPAPYPECLDDGLPNNCVGPRPASSLAVAAKSQGAGAGGPTPAGFPVIVGAPSAASKDVALAFLAWTFPGFVPTYDYASLPMFAANLTVYQALELIGSQGRQNVAFIECDLPVQVTPALGLGLGLGPPRVAATGIVLDARPGGP